MSEVTLRAMTGEEYGAYRTHIEADYAEQMAELGGMTPEAARARSAEQVGELLPDSGPLDGQEVLVAEAGEDGDRRRVGVLWLARRADTGRPTCWVYDVEVDAGERGRGYGRALMLAAEDVARRWGVDRLGLNVFGGNAAAISLYESLGYAVTAQNMAKDLPT